MDASTRVVSSTIHPPTLEDSTSATLKESDKRIIETDADQKPLAMAPQKNIDDSSKHPRTHSMELTRPAGRCDSSPKAPHKEIVAQARLNTSSLRDALTKIRSRASSNALLSVSSVIAASTPMTYEFKDSGKLLRKGRKRKVSLILPDEEEQESCGKKKKHKFLLTEKHNTEFESESESESESEPEPDCKTAIEFVSKPTDKDILMGKKSYYDLPGNIAYRMTVRNFQKKVQKRDFHVVAIEALDYIYTVLGARFLRLVSAKGEEERWRVLPREVAKIKVGKALRELKIHSDFAVGNCKVVDGISERTERSKSRKLVSSDRRCDYCGQIFSVFGFWKHRKTCARNHGENKDSDEDNAAMKQSERPALASHDRRCDYCGRIFSVFGFSKHRKTCARKRRKNKESDKDKVDTKQSKRPTLASHNRRCDYCGRIFSVFGFSQHRKTCARIHRENDDDEITKESLAVDSSSSFDDDGDDYVDDDVDKDEESVNTNSDEQCEFCQVTCSCNKLGQQNETIARKPFKVVRKCRYCGKSYNARGVVTHEKACARKKGVPYTDMFADGETTYTEYVQFESKDAVSDTFKEETENESQLPKVEDPPTLPNAPVKEGELVWVKQGKTDHMAMYIGNPRTEEGKEMVQVKWTTNRLVQYVPRYSVRIFEMDNRRGGRQRRGRSSEASALPTHETKRRRRVQKTQHEEGQEGFELIAPEIKIRSPQQPPVRSRVGLYEKVKSISSEAATSAKQNPHSTPVQKQSSIMITNHDVVMGSHNIASHPGNRAYRDIVRQFKTSHGNNFDDKELATKILRHLRDNGVRFLDYNDAHKCWREAQETESYSKILHALEGIDHYENKRTNEEKRKPNCISLEDNDVIMSNNKTPHHPGNKKYREILQKYKRENPSGDPYELAQKVIDHVRRVLGGRFVVYELGGWTLQSEKEVERRVRRWLNHIDRNIYVEPTDLDVLFYDVGDTTHAVLPGLEQTAANSIQNNMNNEHPGTRQFLLIVAASEENYNAACTPEREKLEITRAVFGLVTKNGGRFLRKYDDVWKKMTDSEACTEIQRVLASNT